MPLYVTMANPHVVLCIAEVSPGRQGLLGGLGSGLEDTGKAWGRRMPFAQWGPQGQGCGEKRRAGGEKSECVSGGLLTADTQDPTSVGPNSGAAAQPGCVISHLLCNLSEPQFPYL